MTAQKILLMSLTTLFIAHNLSALSNLARNDAYPVFSTLDPHTFLYTREKMDIKNLDYGTDHYEYLSLSITPFGQTADLGKDYDGTSTDDSDTVPLGDVTGRWSMIPMTFNNGNACQNGLYPCDLSCTLTRARTALFPATEAIYLDPQNPDNTTYETAYNDQGFNNPNAIDPAEMFGFFSNDLKYTKRGVRLELDANVGAGFGFSIQTGVVDIRQTLLHRRNLTCEASTACGYDLAEKNALLPDELKRTRSFTLISREAEPNQTVDNFENLTTTNVNKYLMEEVSNIARENCYDICSFHDTGIEEIRLNLYWRKALEVNKDRTGYPKCLFIPFFMASGSFSPTTISPSKVFAVPFGNNGHNAYGFTGGLNFDFFESIEVGGEAGLTHFGSRDICGFHVPNSPLQQGLFPFTTTVNYRPGHNWHCAAKFAARNFMTNLSMFFQFVVVHHEHDCIQLKKTPKTCCNGYNVNFCGFRPDVLEKRSSWSTKVGNLGVNYEVSPNIVLGFLWQAPLSQRGTYRSSTVMLSFNGTY